MSWARYYSKKFLGPYLGYMAPETAQKYMNVARMLYFFSTTSIAYLVWDAYKNHKDPELESGMPIIKDLSPAHKKFREGIHDIGVFYEYVQGKGMTKIELTKDEYYKILEDKALEEAKAAQRKALDEGRELPPNANKLI